MNKTIKELEDMGLTNNQIIELFGKSKAEEFFEWMKGQTVGIIDNVEVNYYNDIRSFFSGGLL